MYTYVVSYGYNSPDHEPSPSGSESSAEPSPEPSPDPAHSPSAPSTQERRGRGSGQGRRGRHGAGRRVGRQMARCRQSQTPAEDEKWLSTLSEIPIPIEEFNRDTGPTIPVSSKPSDVFSSFFTGQLIDHIVTESNRYAAACLTTSHTGNGPVPEWNTCEEEIRAYLGFCILMGITKLPDLYDYWSTTDTLHYFPVASRIPRKRFLEIQRYLHFSDNDSIIPHGQEGYDRLAKVRPVIDFVRTSFLQNYHPHKENAVDEAIPPNPHSSIQVYTLTFCSSFYCCVCCSV